MLLKTPFWGVLVMRLNFKEIDKNGPLGWIDTMAVDGKNLWYCPEFVEKIGGNLQQLIGVLAHEVSHITDQHITRRGARNPTFWNYAGDHLINLRLKSCGFQLPEPHLADPKYEGWITDQVYNDLIKEAKEITVCIGAPGEDGEKGDQEQMGQWGIVIDARDENGNPVSDHERQKIETDWKIATIQAANSAKAQGNLPGIMQDYLAELLDPKIPWQQELAEWMTETVQEDYRWTPPNRRMIWTGMVLPGRADISALGELVICIDTSGSMSPDEINSCLTEVNSLKQLCNPSKMWVHFCDTRITKTLEYEGTEDIDLVKLDDISRGGTSFDPVFDWIDERGVNPVGLIYLTDMECYLERDEPMFPVLWGSTTPNKDTAMPFGKVIYIT
jgi:predicted metal-dependent peptidase